MTIGAIQVRVSSFPLYSSPALGGVQPSAYHLVLALAV